MRTLEDFLKPSQKELFGRLCKMYTNAAVCGGKYILVPGEAPVLLVAHLDTVHQQPVRQICKTGNGNILMSPQGIGGDDRCGVYALVKVHRTAEKKPWLLFTCDEEIGGVGARKFCEHHKKGKLPKELDGLNRDNVSSLSEHLPKKNPSLAVTYMNRLLRADSTAMRQRLLSDFEIEADKDLAVSKTLGKMGPMLGLMGTLIPMGPALVGLSTGDIASMAYNMQVAFATTVVGLFAAAIGFVTEQVKQRWYLQEMTDLEFVAELLNEIPAER